MGIRGGNKDSYAKIILLVIIVVWGLNTPVMKIGLMALPPLVYNACRLVIAASLSLAVLLITKTYKPMPLDDLKKIARIGVFGFFVNQFFIMYGMTHTTAGNAALVFATLPVEVAIINRVFRIEAISRRMTAGIITGLLGVLLIVLGSNKELSLFGPHLLGAMFLLIGQFGYGYYTVFIKELNGRYSIYQIFTYILEYSIRGRYVQHSLFLRVCPGPGEHLMDLGCREIREYESSTVAVSVPGCVACLRVDLFR